MNKPRVLFVAGLDPVAEGGAGGQQAVASRLYASPLRQACELVPLSSTQRRSPPPSLPVRAFYAAKRLFRFLVSIPKVDVVLIFTSDGFGLIEKGLYCLIARGLGKGVVLRIGSGRIPEIAQNRLWRAWLRVVFAAAHVVCSQGSFWTTYFKSFPEAQGKIVAAPNGVLVPEYSYRHHPQRANLAFTGRLTREKGLFELLEAFRHIAERFPQARLYLAGGGPDREELEQRSSEWGIADKVSFLGWLSPREIQGLLSETDVFVLPSHFEGMSNALLEAMATGIPVVTTLVGAAGDLVVHEQTGYAVEVGDVSGIVREVCKILSAPDASRLVGERGRALVASTHDLSKVWLIFWDSIQRAARTSQNGLKGQEDWQL